MNALRVLAVAMVLGAPAVLGGCAVVDLAAHGIKEYEKSKDGARTAQSAREEQPQAQPAAARRDEPEPPPPMASGVPQRESVTVETLPAR